MAVRGAAQQRAMPTIGWLDVRSANAPSHFVDAFRVGLAEMGFAEGRNVAIDYRYADNHGEGPPALAAELDLRSHAGLRTCRDSAR
jgi:putative ABC transport system substrate-binding protein